MSTTAYDAPLELEHTVCNLCGEDCAEPVLTGTDLRRRIPGEFRVVRCQRCGLAYVDPRPTQSGIGRYYPPDYQPHDKRAPSQLESLYYRMFRPPPVARGRVLDVGCGNGRYLQFLRQRGLDAAGTEVDPKRVAWLRDEFGFDAWAGALPDADVPEAAFDAVTLWWVLEHTHDPLATLRAAHRALGEGGRLVVAVQNFASVGRLAFGAHWHHLDLPGHLYQFEPETLTQLLDKAGFRVTRLRHDLLAKDCAPSLGYKLGLERSLDRLLPNVASLPFDLLGWCLRRSGLITAYATRR